MDRLRVNTIHPAGKNSGNVWKIRAIWETKNGRYRWREIKWESKKGDFMHLIKLAIQRR